MSTLTVDGYKRIRIPDAKPGQVFAYENEGGRIVLTPMVKNKPQEHFPRGSLLKYFTPEKDAEETVTFKGCAKG